MQPGSHGRENSSNFRVVPFLVVWYGTVKARLNHMDGLQLACMNGTVQIRTVPYRSPVKSPGYI